MRISIAVHGRFHAFDLAAALLRHGEDVHLLTNYPASVVARWFPAERTISYRRHGLLSRALRAMARGEPPPLLEASLKRMFGRWVARQHAHDPPAVMHCWSGVAEETLRACGTQTICTVARGSAHIKTQFDLLAEEELRVGRRLEKPSAWIRAREQREYGMAHRVIVPSTFARDSFLQQGQPAERVAVVNLALRARGFAADNAAIEQRLRRLRSHEPLRVLYVGMLSYRKGMHDLQSVMQRLGKRMQFRLVGPVLAECRDFARTAAHHAQVDGAVAESALLDVYAWGDVFVLPTIEDGFAVVLAQAQAAGLPILTTTNCGGPDILAGGGEGWVVPIRDADAIAARLEWCEQHRGEVAFMVEQLHRQPPQRDWDDVARDLLQAITA